MELQLSHLTRRAKGGVSVREEAISAETVRIGRGTGNEIFLSDPRVPLRMGAMTFRAGALHIEATAGLDLRVNGTIMRVAALQTGDVVGVGPYELTVAAAPDGKDAALTLELTQPVGDDLQALEARSCMELNRAAWLGKRGWSWLLAVLVAVVFVGLPIAGAKLKPEMQGSRMEKANQGIAKTGFDVVWKSGDMMGPHRFFGDDCATCHKQPFEQVRNDACTACHQKQAQHVAGENALGGTLERAQCQSCHNEHQGPYPRLMTREALCTACHETLTTTLPQAKVIDTSGFTSNHPEFRPTVSTNPAQGTWERISLADKPREVSNLKFPHKTHLDKAKMRRPDGTNVQLDCINCHVPEPGGGIMRPLDRERDCGECHRLTFDAAAPDRTVTHGKPLQVLRELREYFAARALEGGVPDEQAPAVVRRRPGTELTEEGRKAALAWAGDRAASAMRYMFSFSQCGGCHYVKADGPMEQWTVEPVVVTSRWQPKSVFSHARHSDMDCANCHAAAESLESSDVLLPGIASCQGCHGDERTHGLLPSPCITCHIFHRPELAPMGASLKAAGTQ
jgi:predicted CXXCH cytochrome family protein